MFKYKTEWTNPERFLGKALHLAVMSDDINRVRELINNPELDMSYIWEPLPYELKDKSPEVIELVTGIAPVLFKARNTEVFAELLKHPNALGTIGKDGARSFYTDAKGDTIFHAEIERPAVQGIERFKELLNVFPDAYAIENNMGVPVYQKIISNDRLDLLEELLRRDMAKIMGNDVLWAIVAFAPRRMDEMEKTNRMLDLLEKFDWEINVTDSKDGTPLHWAARMGNEAMIEVLLARGVDSEKKDSRGMTYVQEIMMQKDSGHIGYRLPAYDSSIE